MERLLIFREKLENQLKKEVRSVKTELSYELSFSKGK